MTKNVVLLTVVALMTFPAMGKEYEPIWESLQEYQCPEWFREMYMGNPDLVNEETHDELKRRS